MSIHTQANADAGAPGNVGTVGHGLAIALQRTPAALGLQRGDGIVFNPHLGKDLAQGCFEQCALPVIGQTARRPGEAAADVGRGQFHPAIAQQKRAAGGHAQRGQFADSYARKLAALFQQAKNLKCHRVRCALARGGLRHAPAHALRIDHADRHPGAANIDAGHGRGASGQFEDSALKIAIHVHDVNFITTGALSGRQVHNKPYVRTFGQKNPRSCEEGGLFGGVASGATKTPTAGLARSVDLQFGCPTQ